MYVYDFVILFCIIQFCQFWPNVADEKSVKIRANFDLHFTCGRYHGAEGRLFIRAQKGGFFDKLKFVPDIVDVVLDQSMNGHFHRSIVINSFLRNKKQKFIVYFITDCYMLNRFGECCAHEFRFEVPITFEKVAMSKDYWFTSNYDGEFLFQPICKHTWSGKVEARGLNCSFTFATLDRFNPSGETDYIDLMGLLRNPQRYREVRLVELHKNDTSKSNTEVLAFTSKRRCSPRDDADFMSDFYGKNGWAICDHPNYGLRQASFERPGQRELQDFDVMEWENCKCYKPTECRLVDPTCVGK